MDRIAPIVILDDFFPALQTGFRVAEYNHYMRVFAAVTIACSTGQFAAVHAEYARLYPRNAERVIALDQFRFGPRDLVYMNFLNNAAQFLPLIEAAGRPFLFSLYPGGGFDLNDAQATAKLDRVLASPLLRAVITTQPVASQVLRQRGCPVPVHEIYGVTINPAYFSPALTRLGPPPAAGAARICFAAYKYVPHGATKGYPEFVAAAERLAEAFPQLRFTVIGNFGPEDVALSPELAARTRFAGVLPTLELRRLFRAQDLIVSPTHAFGVSGSVFDGFPTASTVEAMLCGVAAICSDELSLNRHFRPGEEAVICAPEADCIVAAATRLLADPAALARLGHAGQRRCRQLFSAEQQLLPRTRVLRELALQEGSLKLAA